MNKDSLDFIFKPNSSITNELTVARMESLRKAALRAQPPKKVIGGKIRTTPDGWILEIQPGSPQIDSHPFQVKIKNSQERKVTISSGKVNNTIPSIDGTRLIETPAPELTLPTSELVYIYIKVEVDGSMEATSVSIVAETEEQSDTLDLTSGGIGYELIATATINDGEIATVSQLLNSNIYHRAYLRHIFWT